MPERTYIELMEQQRLLLLTALGATASGRPLTAREETGIEQALAQLTRQADHIGCRPDAAAEPGRARRPAAQPHPGDGRHRSRSRCRC